MRISAQLKDDISKVVIITIFFVFINWFMTFYNDGLINTEYSKGPSDIYNLRFNYLINTITGLLSGSLGGSMLVFVNHRFFRKTSYGYALKVTFIGYTTIFIFVTITMAFATARLSIGAGENFQKYYEEASIFMFSQMALVFYLFWAIVTLFTVFFLQISDKFGPGMLSRFLIGMYHSPREEQRIFMFMDMKSSTTIAEQIGSKQYFNLLNDLFNDITDPILSCEGEIYQYVGDEVVISWSLGNGIKEANCLRCFIKARETLANLAPYYESTYGVKPTFKAGLHYGMVTAGEVGSIKKDIAYSGDVLNTASRIQEQCNHFEVDFLISKDTFDLLGTDHSFEAIHLGNIELRGKKNMIDLNTVKSF